MSRSSTATGTRVATTLTERSCDAGSTRRYRFFVFDFETTGLSPASDRVVEVAVQEYIKGQTETAMKPISALVNPGIPMPYAAQRVHKISDSMVANAGTFTAAWEDVETYVKARLARGERAILVAHNAKFDAGFLRTELARASMPEPTWLFACSLPPARDLWPDDSVSLGNLTERLGAKHTAHRAKGDVIALAMVLDAMNDLFEAKGSNVHEELINVAKPLDTYPADTAKARRSTRRRSTLRAATLPANTAAAAPATSSAAPASGAAPSSAVRTTPAPVRTTPAPVRTTPAPAPARTTLAPAPARTTPVRITPTPPAPVHTAPVAARGPPSTDLTTPLRSDEVLYTATGECYHGALDCEGLRKARTTMRCKRTDMPSGLRACRVCGGSPGAGRAQYVVRDSWQSSPRSVMPSNNDEAEYYRTYTGAKYHIKKDCYGLRKARAIIPCDSKPTDLDPCMICVQRIAYQNY